MACIKKTKRGVCASCEDTGTIGLFGTRGLGLFNIHCPECAGGGLGGGNSKTAALRHKAACPPTTGGGMLSGLVGSMASGTDAVRRFAGFTDTAPLEHTSRDNSFGTSVPPTRVGGSQAEDVLALMVWGKDAKYKGQQIDGGAEGYGVLQHFDGDTYEGQFRENMPHGHGVFQHAGGTKYEGQWRGGRQDGWGKEECPDGSVYDGQWQNGLKHGNGKFIWSNGSVYEGNFLNNDMCGHGLLSGTMGPLKDNFERIS